VVGRNIDKSGPTAVAGRKSSGATGLEGTGVRFRESRCIALDEAKIRDSHTPRIGDRDRA
jgi:hypothetical protein